jgi:hypothetical protein
MSVTAWVGALLAAAVLAASPAAAAKAAAVNIGIAPSPNGLVMKGEPTQIAVSGVPSATILIWNAEQKKWFRIGKATSEVPQVPCRSYTGCSSRVRAA